MAARIRNLVAAQCVAALQGTSHRVTSRSLAANLTLHWDKKTQVRLVLPCSSLPLPSSSLHEYVYSFPLLPERGLSSLSLTPDLSSLHFPLPTHTFVSEVLATTHARPDNYDWTRNALFEERRREVMVEFSSPNIAKPFHVGHLRSTILGNFVALVQERAGHRVTRLNYLGDWGTQFGLLVAGLERRGLGMGEVRAGFDPVSTLLEVYIEANRAAEEEEGFALKAREAFARLERGDEETLEVWRQCREVSVEELERSYRRLGVRFDLYHGESMYSSSRSAQVLEDLEARGAVEVLEDGRKVVQGSPHSRSASKVTVVKSDDTGLYITRDLAAALDRKERYNFDRMYYVVDNDQQSHFRNIFHILGDLLSHEWSKDCHHVRFGRILGMSTRKGSMVTVEQLLQEAEVVMEENQRRSPNTRVAQGGDSAERMAVSALVIHDLSKRRAKDYKFSWSAALNSKGNTGVRLQYTHASLHSLLEACSPLLGSLEEQVDTSHLVEPEALELVYLIGQWDETLALAASSLEPRDLVHFLYSLASATSRALRALQVKGLVAGSPEVARARLLLFACAKKVLAEGLTVLGVTPMDQV